jgi:hypothetical protein
VTLRFVSALLTGDPLLINSQLPLGASSQVMFLIKEVTETVAGITPFPFTGLILHDFNVSVESVPIEVEQVDPSTDVWQGKLQLVLPLLQLHLPGEDCLPL